MAYFKGLIPKDKVSVFLDFLGTYGYAFRQSTVRYELGQVLIVGRWMAITVDSKDVVGIPEELTGYVKEFLQSVFNTGAGITDTQRLDFMLSEHRKVVIEIEGWGSEGRHYAVYVEEGFMGDRQYEGVRFTQAEEFSGSSEQGARIKREAIDLAINNPPEEVQE